MTTPPSFSVSQNCDPDCEAAINYQIALELYAAHMFHIVACYINSEEEALKQFVPLFLQQANKEREHAQSLMWLQNQRGGRIKLEDIYSPDPSCWKNGLSLMECTFHLKMSVNQSLFDLHQLAVEKRDANLCDFLKGNYLFQQMQFIQVLGEHLANLHQMGGTESSLAEDLCAKLTLSDSDKKT